MSSNALPIISWLKEPQLSETFRSDSPADLPEYQRTLEDLVATNALLKHDASELGQMLTDSRSEVRNLRKEVDELRAAIGVAGRLSPEVTIQQHVAIELSHSHSRTESSPLVGSFTERTGGAKMSVAHPNRAGNISSWEHHRRTSMARSMASTSTADGLTSPGLGMGPIGEFGGALLNDEVIALSPPPLDGRESPKPIFRTSPSGGIAYVLHGVPKSRASLPRPPARRSVSVDRPRPGARSFSVGALPYAIADVEAKVTSGSCADR